jgi:TonB family protein
VTWLVAFFIKTTILLGAARAAAFFLRCSSADIRHRLWLSALLGVVILALPFRLPQPVRIDVPVQFSITTVEGALPTHVSGGAWSMWTTVWTVGIVATLLRLLAGVATVALWTRRARCVEGVLISDLAATPLTWGVFRPVILVPAYATNWPVAQFDLTLRHEQAHVARCDWLWQMLANTVSAVFWFHPLIWLATAELRSEAENATDDLVLASGVDATNYAEHLMQVARHISNALPLATVPMARTKLLESRVRKILNPFRRRDQASFATRVAVTALVGVGLILLLAVEEKSVLRADELPDIAFPLIPRTTLIAQDGVMPTVKPATPRSATTPSSAPAIPMRPVLPVVLPRHEPVSASAPGVTTPRPIYRAEPRYTDDARASKLEGSVLLSIVINEKGRPEEIKVTRSLEPGLDEQAIEAVQQWQFTPGMKDGSPIAVTAVIEVNFRLL